MVVAVACPQCGGQNPDGARFCMKCGGALVVPSPAPPGAEQQRSAPDVVSPPPIAAPRYTQTPPESRKRFPWLIAIVALLGLLGVGLALAVAVALTLGRGATPGVSVPGKPAAVQPTPAADAAPASPATPPSAASPAASPLASQPAPPAASAPGQAPAASPAQTTAPPASKPAQGTAQPGTGSSQPVSGGVSGGATPPAQSPAGGGSGSVGASASAPASSQPQGPTGGTTNPGSGAPGTGLAPVPQSKTPVSLATVQYQDPAYAFAINYPEGWQISRDYATGLTTFYKDDVETTVFGVAPANMLGSVMDADTLVQFMVNQNQKSYPDFTLVSKSSQPLGIAPSVPGVPGAGAPPLTKISFTATWTNAAGIKVKGTMNIVMMASIQLGQTFMQIFYYHAPITTFAQLQPTFTSMETSLRW